MERFCEQREREGKGKGELGGERNIYSLNEWYLYLLFGLAVCVLHNRERKVAGGHEVKLCNVMLMSK